MELPIFALSVTTTAPALLNSSWIFSNAVSHLDESQLKNGCAFVFMGKLKRWGVYDRHGSIAVRLFPFPLPTQFESKNVISHEDIIRLIADHLKKLKANKDSFCFAPGDAIRLAHGDNDGLPGIVIDDYKSFFAIQSNCQAGDFLIEFIVDALKIFEDKPIFERSSGQTRTAAGLPERTRWVYSENKNSTPNIANSVSVEAQLAGLKLSFSPTKAQKTGLFLDQRENLNAVSRFSKSAKSVLDICCYAGAWSSAAAREGATDFVLIDQDSKALENADANIRKNSNSGINSVEKRHGDLFENLAILGKENKTFDLVVADPPAFAKSKKHIIEARKAYMRMAKAASKCVAPGGILVICSCSRHMSPEEFEKAVVNSLSGHGWVLLARGNQSPDHTIVAQSAGGEYLKCLFLKKPFEHQYES